MMTPRLSHLQRAVQKLGLEGVIPDLSQVSDAKLQAPFAKYLSFGECHEDLGIAENFDPTILPSVSFTEVKNVTDRSSLMSPYFCTISVEEIQILMSADLRDAALREALLDSDDFLRCRLFFQAVVQAVEEGYYIIILKNKEHTIALFLHIKALRMLKALPDTDQREAKETVLFQVEYYCMSHEEFTRSEEDYENIMLDLMKQHSTGKTAKTKTRITFGTANQIHFVHQVLQAHERLLEKSVISKHDKEWNPRQKYIRPSFIIPLRTIALCTSSLRDFILQEIKGAFMPAVDTTVGDRVVESDNNVACAACGKTNVQLKLCSMCKAIKYCTRECQVSDWQSHKQTCKGTGSDPKWSRLWSRT